MSSIQWNDLTCTQQSSSMSCMAMRDLAMKEADENQTQMMYLLDDPSCERYHSIYDKGQLNGTVLSRRLCFTHDPALKQGAYQQQYENGFTPNYDQWTRRKDISAPYTPPDNMTPINADVWNNMSSDASAITKCGTGGNTNTFLPNTAIPYGISANEQSSVPADFLQSMGCCK